MADEEEAREFQADRPAWASAPPVLLLENVRHLIAHDERRTFRVIRRRLMQSGYLVSYRVINGAIWVPQNRQRTVIVALRADLFADGGKFEFHDPGDPKAGPKLDDRVLEPDGEALERYRLTDGVWNALRAPAAPRGQGFRVRLRDRRARRGHSDAQRALLQGRRGDPAADAGRRRPRRLTPTEAAA